SHRPGAPGPCRLRAPPPRPRRGAGPGRGAGAPSPPPRRPGRGRSPGLSSRRLPARRPSRDQLLRTQCQPELDAVVGAAQVPPGELLDALDPVPERMPVAVAVAVRALPVAIAVDVGLEGSEQLPGIALVGILDRPQDALAVEAQRL